MNQIELEAKVKEVFSDKEYVMSLLNMETPEEAQESLAGKGLDFSIDELRKLRNIVLKSGDGEITDEDLEKVAGGSLVAAGIAASITALVGIFLGPTVNFATRGRW